MASRWQDLKLDSKYLFLNPGSSYCRWRPTFKDPRATPAGQFASDDQGTSYGLIDDVCDGLISCRIVAARGQASRPDLVAWARICVTPPDYAPDRRHIVSLADGLKDRVDRAQVHKDAFYVADEALCDAEIRELLRRAYETVYLINLDAFNNRVNVQENFEFAVREGLPFKDGQFIAFPPYAPREGCPLPLVDVGRDYHRRLHVLEALIHMIRKDPTYLSKYIREPLEPLSFFSYRMPAIMQGVLRRYPFA